jgi:hypothetical protein
MYSRMLPNFSDYRILYRRLILVVKTLAIRSTVEEMMVARRDALKTELGATGGKFPNLTDDRIMRDFIEV